MEIQGPTQIEDDMLSINQQSFLQFISHRDFEDNSSELTGLMIDKNMKNYDYETE